MTSRKYQNYTRKPCSRKQYTKALIICEDEKFSVKYFNDLCKDWKLKNKISGASSVEVLPSKHSDPASVLEHTKSLLTSALRNNEDLYDRVFCVIDKDDHKNYDTVIKGFNQKVNEFLCEEFKNKNEKPTIELVISNRCFEFWILLHLKYSDRQYESEKELLKDIQSEAERISLKQKTSSVISEILKDQEIKQEEFTYKGRKYGLYEISKDRLDQACKHAKKLHDSQSKDLRIQESDKLTLRLTANPYTEIDQLIQILKELKSEHCS
jgi:hypothetical protein